MGLGRLFTSRSSSASSPSKLSPTRSTSAPRHPAVGPDWASELLSALVDLLSAISGVSTALCSLHSALLTSLDSSRSDLRELEALWHSLSVQALDALNVDVSFFVAGVVKLLERGVDPRTSPRLGQQALGCYFVLRHLARTLHRALQTSSTLLERLSPPTLPRHRSISASSTQERLFDSVKTACRSTAPACESLALLFADIAASFQRFEAGEGVELLEDEAMALESCWATMQRDTEVGLGDVQSGVEALVKLMDSEHHRTSRPHLFSSLDRSTSSRF